MLVTAQKMTLKRAKSIAGTLGSPSKMPGLSYGISAKNCITGAKLAKIEGTVCHGCYALKANYSYPSVQKAHETRGNSLNNPLWVQAMVTQITASKTDYFRWHDAGDLQSFQHLLNIVSVAEQCPSVMFWLPTKEKKFISQYNDTFGAFPCNLIVRVSGAMVDGTRPDFEHTSTVVTNADNATCRAFENKNKCGDCRKCWDKSVDNVSYLKH
jgi:Gene product 88